ncbi:hypothetical protein TYRP_001433 [Tyrophagus putrescentiae]|nr:hypothetical protein TYRP_001433 [Tyrophagus putrescentiae]
MATNTTTTNSLPPPSSPMFTETLINKICCSIINRLLGALHCFSPPVGDLHELDDGVVLVELIESFEEAIFVRYPQLINPQNNAQQRPFRNALSRTGSRSNMEYVEQWLMLEGVNLDPKRSIREIFAEIRRSSQELATFLGTFSEDDLSDNNSLGTMLQKQRVAIYARSIAYISALCYAIFTIFLKHDEQFKRLIPGFRFTVEPDELLHILFYTKWKLTEEELLIKDLEFMRLKDSADLLEIENRRLKGLKRENDSEKSPHQNSSNSELSSYQQQQQQKQSNSTGQTPYHNQQMINSTSTSTSTAQNSPHFSSKNHSKQTSSELHDFESVSSITISSVAELRSVSTQTDIFGLENQLHVQYGFNRKLMEMTVAKDREIAEKVAEQVRAAKAAAEEQRQADARWAAEQEEKRRRRRKNASQEEAQNLAQNTSNSSQHSFQNRTLPDHFCQPELHSHSASTQVPTSAEHSDLPVTPDDPSHFPVHFNGQGQQQKQQQQQQQQQQNYQQQQQQQQSYQHQNVQNQNNRPLLPNYQQTRERNYHPQAVISPPLSPPADDSNEGNSNGRGHHPHHPHQHSNSSHTSNASNNNITSPMLSPQSSPSSSSSVQLRHPKQQQTPAKPERPSSLASLASSNSRISKNTSSNLNRNSSHVHSSIYSRGQFDVLEAQQNSLAGGNFSPQNSTKNPSKSSNEAIQRTPIDFEYNKQQVELSLTGRGRKSPIKGSRQRESPSPRPSQPPPPVPLSAVPTEDHRDYPDGNDNSQTAKNAQDIITTLNNNNNNSNENQSQRTAQHQHQLPPSIDGSRDNDGNGNGNSDDNAGGGDPQTASEKLRQLELIREHHKRNSGRAGYTDDEQLRNRILIARLLAELSYEKNKNLRQTTQDYI